MKILKKLWPDVESNRYYNAQYQKKLSEIDDSFNTLKAVTRDVSNQASITNQLLTRNLELLERRFETIASTVDNIIIIKTINRQWTAINDWACKLLHVDKNKCIGKTNDQVAEIYPQLKLIINTMDSAEKATCKTNSTKHMHIIVKNHGRPYKVNIAVKPIETMDGLAKELVLIGTNLESGENDNDNAK